MKASKSKHSGARRVERHRVRVERSGKTRVEVVVPTTDVNMVRGLAARLRAGGGGAAAAREALAPLLAGTQARTGEELLAFFRASPLVGVDLRIERSKSPGRELQL